jgi:hypothetical protein
VHSLDCDENTVVAGGAGSFTMTSIRADFEAWDSVCTYVAINAPDSSYSSIEMVGSAILQVSLYGGWWG